MILKQTVLLMSFMFLNAYECQTFNKLNSKFLFSVFCIKSEKLMIWKTKRNLHIRFYNDNENIYLVQSGGRIDR